MSCWLSQIVCLIVLKLSFSFLYCHIYFRLPHRHTYKHLLSLNTLTHCLFQSPLRSTTGSGWGQSSVVSCDGHCWQRGIRLIDESRPAGLCTKFFGPGGTAQQEAASCRLLLSELQGRRGKVNTEHREQVQEEKLVYTCNRVGNYWICPEQIKLNISFKYTVFKDNIIYQII